MLTWSFYHQLRVSDPEAFTGQMARVYLFGIPATFLILGALYLPVAVPRLLVYLGDASYSLYLVHGTVLSALVAIVTKLEIGAIFANFAGAITLFAGTLVLSCVFYSVVERRLLTFLNPPSRKIRR